jgi:hypothetical protein
MFQNIVDTLQAYGLVQLLAALLVLVVGWLFAMIVARFVRAALQRMRIDDRLALWVQGDDTPARTADAPRVERIISTVVFWLVMLFVLIWVFNLLNLGGVAAPFTVFLNEIAAFLPRLLSVAFLILLAWVIATVLRIVVRAALNAARFDERIREEANVPTTSAAAAGVEVDTTGDVDVYARPRPGLTDTIANTVYWLVFLFFLPAILDALSLPGLLEPVQGLVNEILRFLPDIALAALILLAGWFVARIVQRIVTNILYATGIDNLTEEAGLSTSRRRISDLLGFVAYVLVLIVVATIALDTLNLGAITEPISNMLNQILAAIPKIFAAVLLLIMAYVVGRLVGGLVTNILAGIGFDDILTRLGLGPALYSGTSAAAATPRRTPSEIAGYLVLVGIMLFAIIEAMEMVGFESIALLVTQFTVFAGQVLLGLLIFAVGLYVANLIAQVIWSSAGKNAGLLALAARISILILAGAMALRQMGLAPEIIQTAFTALIGALAVAVALAFGLGGRDTAARLVKEWADEIEAGSGTNVNPYPESGTPPPGGD